jgi:hypothetical protein
MFFGPVEPWPPDFLRALSAACCRHPVPYLEHRYSTVPNTHPTLYCTSILTGLMRAVSRWQWDNNFPSTSVSSCQ